MRVTVLDWYYTLCSDEIAEDAVIEYGFEPHYCPSSLDEDGFFIRDLDGNGSSELVVMSRTGLSGADDLPVYAVYTLAGGHPIRLFSAGRATGAFCAVTAASTTKAPTARPIPSMGCTA